MVAGDCYDLFVTKQGDIALIVVDIAGHGATEGILALRCKEVLRTALTSGAQPGDALAHHRRAARRHGRRGLPHRVRRGDRHRATAASGTRTPGIRPRIIVREAASDELGPTGPLVGLLEPGWSTAETTIGAG